MSDAPEEVAWQGKWITAKRRGKWEYVARARGIRAAAIVAIDADGHVLLVDQYRVPLGKRCLELPAGLIGDEAGHEDDSPFDAARRELIEETGYDCAAIEDLGEYHSSPGLVSESFTLVRATGLTRVGEGGGLADEDILVHRVPRAEIAAFVAAKRAEGLAIDVKLLLLLSGALLGD
ncbi:MULTISPECIES: NUDIX hydrolase [Sphingomonas]|uniref:GDP-mannose pyrophosphatase n=1 Tax=Sphingomonas leidyi TaxID=68569 RepID=A0A7X5V0T9_9SPHN|nr:MULTISPECIES: NUDIX hydrolase [unclassified Sphingomonas]MBN8810374.1 NUDIX hydrolase [Sphingomonas sp.]NIJ65455.1 ADP-ribose pyrophosphatase [Sphingomonas leidyi]OJY50915.1 MAG: NUDIX hydrolase [Sphingomonas sp. 67-41]